MPKTRREVVAAFSSILDRGGVQKVVVEVGRPIQVVQLVDKSMATPPMETPIDDLWGAVRNAKLEELSVPKGKDGAVLDGYQTLFYGFARLAEMKLKPKALFIHHYGQAREWLKLSADFPLEFIYGVEVGLESDVPEDAVILVGMSWDENPMSATGLRVPVDVKRKKA